MADSWKHCEAGLESASRKYLYDSDFFAFFKGKKILVTGISGFKGAWMLKVLHDAGADVTGFSLKSPTDPALFEIINGRKLCHFIEGDVRNITEVYQAVHESKPEIVIHMAAQPIVRESYLNPVYTYETNVMGTVNLLEAIKSEGCVKSFLNVTTDKVYLNNEWEWGYKETDPLDGFDPYSNSKSCSEIITHSYKNSFFGKPGYPDTAISTARAGNVIGGGDFAKDRIIPDCVRAAMEGKTIDVRNPYSTRPYQHVLEPVMAYLMIVRESYLDHEAAGWYNVGPDESDCVSTGDLVDMFCGKWGEGLSWKNLAPAFAPHEAGLLKLDCSKIKRTFGWRPRWNASSALDKTVEWTKVYISGGDVAEEMSREIKEYCDL
ncbi:MAG: CDP-glucose 4,6-dehydratase [Clostridia bacterium]|nr:CDP-glucose 4,6-dehydratase [Clostridia bacterium]